MMSANVPSSSVSCNTWRNLIPREFITRYLRQLLRREKRNFPVAAAAWALGDGNHPRSAPHFGEAPAIKTLIPHPSEHLYLPAKLPTVARVSDSASRLNAQRLESGARLALVGVVVNALLAGLKIAAGIVGHCYALIADGIESTLDIFSSIFIWFGLRVAAEPPDEDHPYGHGKAEALSSIAVSVVISQLSGLKTKQKFYRF